MQNKMHRWSNEHPLPVHIPDGYLDRFILISPTKPPNAKSSSGVSIESYQMGGEWVLEFHLNSPRFESAFKSLYEDLFDSTWTTDPRNAASVFIDIYNKWRQAFSSKSNRLSAKEIQGITGEMIAIRDILSDILEPRKLLESWMLTGYGKQDFITGNTWYEVKTSMEGSDTIKISSIEQLDENKMGMLIVIKLRKTSSEDSEKVTVNTIIGELYRYFAEYGCGEDFLRMLSEFDLPSEKYDEYCYRLCSCSAYEVGQDFPCIRRNNIPDSVENVEYTLNLRAIESFKVM